jgi:putative hemolysin
VDIDAVLKEKNPKLARRLPRFIINWIKRLVHEQEFNDAMVEIGHYRGLDFARAGLDYLNTSVTVRGEENIPHTGKVIFAANHPLGGLDGIAFLKAVGEYREDVLFLVNDILMNVENLKELFVPVNKVGKNPRQATEKIEQAYRSDKAILIFPAGLVSRKIDGSVQDLLWRKSFIAKSIAYERSIVPVYIDGKNSRFFYNFANWRKRLGIKVNLEMMLLPKEMFRQRNKTIEITFGKPILYTYFTPDKSHADWAFEVRKKVYSLGEE